MYPCKRFACAIQACLNKHHFNETKCQKELKEFEECCKNLDRTIPDASIACASVWKRLEKSL
jgi:hypothetical protein